MISDYDAGQACNVVVELDHISHRGDIVRSFVCPRARRPPNYSVTADLLYDNEQILMNNNPGGVRSEWPFAGVEMGLLTQVDVEALTLGETDDDWKAFLDIIQKRTGGV